MWSPDPTGQAARRRSGAIKARHDVWGPDSLVHMSGCLLPVWWWARGALVISSSGGHAATAWTRWTGEERGQRSRAGAKGKGILLSTPRHWSVGPIGSLAT
jgi:hypothetical protein